MPRPRPTRPTPTRAGDLEVGQKIAPHGQHEPEIGYRPTITWIHRRDDRPGLVYVQFAYPDDFSVNANMRGARSGRIYREDEQVIRYTTALERAAERAKERCRRNQNRDVERAEQQERTRRVGSARREGAPVADPITNEEALRIVQEADERVQTVAFNMGLLGADAEKLAESQQVFHNALGPAGADIDDDTLVAVGAMQAATSAVQQQTRVLVGRGSECLAQTGAALTSLDGHRQLSEAVQAHRRAGRMSWYHRS